MKDVIVQKAVGVGIAAGGLSLLPTVNVEYGVYGAIFQATWILMGYLFSIKSGKKRNLPPLYYVGNAMLSFILCVFLAQPIHLALEQGKNWHIDVKFIILTIAIISEHAYDIINKLIKMLEGLIPDLREYLANKLKNKGDD
jgi:hypothetical protein